MYVQRDAVDACCVVLKCTKQNVLMEESRPDEAKTTTSFWSSRWSRFLFTPPAPFFNVIIIIIILLIWLSLLCFFLLNYYHYYDSNFFFFLAAATQEQTCLALRDVGFVAFIFSVWRAVRKTAEGQTTAFFSFYCFVLFWTKHLHISSFFSFSLL